MLGARTIEIVKATAPAVAQHAEAITRRFYEIMFAENPEVKAFFNQAHQGSGGQQRALAGAICAYAANIDNLGALGPAVELIAQKHASLGIRPEHYPIVGKHLLTAIRQILGSAASDEVIDAWGKAYFFLADIFINREAAIYHSQQSAPGGWNGYRPFVVEKKVRESEVVTSFYLRPQDGGLLPSFLPGQYITVRASGLATPTSPRNYSLSDRPGAGHYRISVKREPGSGAAVPGGVISNHLHDDVQAGDVLQIGPPCGEFTLDLATATAIARPIVLVSGGIGITPVLSMFKALAHRRVKTPVHFIHAAQNSRVHAMADEVRQVAAEFEHFQTHFRYSQPLPGDLETNRCDSIGLIDNTLLENLLPPTPADFYFCGPKPFMTGFYQLLKRRDVAESHIHFEFFGPRAELAA